MKNKEIKDICQYQKVFKNVKIGKYKSISIVP